MLIFLSILNNHPLENRTTKFYKTPFIIPNNGGGNSSEKLEISRSGREPYLKIVYFSLFKKMVKLKHPFANLNNVVISFQPQKFENLYGTTELKES